ncbi:S8 family serine peptidase [Paenibacillus sp. GCM10027626]|uniref:S8 family peptidase n=1 Tax=Paenibacillus sp. GCM10027626 TaxID=3273411 RepID=UPI00362E6584
MRKVEHLLRKCHSRSTGGHTVRHLIVLKSEQHYKCCLRELRKHGLKPHKSIKGERLLCCSIDSRLTDRLSELASHPAVRYIEPDVKVKAHGIPLSKRGQNTIAATSRGFRPAPPLIKRRLAGRISINCPYGTPWNICRVQAPAAWRRTRGDSVRVAIVDTGIAKHPDLRIAGGVNIISRRKSFHDDNGHGTHVAGIAAALGSNGQIPGVAPAVKLYAVKVLDSGGSGYTSDIVEGIDWCIRNRIQVINMSLGLTGGTSKALLQAVRRARRHGIIVVASAGNDGKLPGKIDEPASYKETIAVAASTPRNTVAPYSTRGKGIDVTAPGSDIKSTWLNKGYHILEGTSMACPHVTGAAALILASRPGISVNRVTRKIRQTARRLPGFSSLAQGHGLLQAARALSSAGAGRKLRRRRRQRTLKLKQPAFL